MSSAVLPSLAGYGFPAVRTSIWDNDTQTSISGKENRLAYWTYPKYSWKLDVNVLRSIASPQDFQSLLGFCNARQGGFDSFLYQDPDDNSVTAQAIGTGNGSTTTFQLVKSFGGFIEPVLAPNTGGTINIYLNGVKQTTGYTISAWGTMTPGALTFVSAPGNGIAITADFSYYYPCRFASDKTEFSLDFQGLYSVKSLSWQSVKN